VYAVASSSANGDYTVRSVNPDSFVDIRRPTLRVMFDRSPRTTVDANGKEVDALPEIGADLVRTDPGRATEARDRLTGSLAQCAGHRETLGTALTYKHLGNAASLETVRRPGSTGARRLGSWTELRGRSSNA
jgi:hypothetical protein